MAVLAFCVPVASVASQISPQLRLVPSGPEIAWASKPLIRRELPPIATLDGQNRLYVLDDQRMVIDVFDGTGQTVAVIPDAANAVRGFAPTMFAVSQDTIVAAVGRYDRTIYFFRIRGNQVRFMRKVPLTQNAVSVCAVGPDFLVSLEVTGGEVWRLSSEGKVISKSRIASPEVPPMQLHFHDVSLFAKNASFVVAVKPTFPTVSAIEPSGRVIWQTNLKSFRQIEISQINANKMTVRWPENGFHSVVGVYFVSEDLVAVQLVLAIKDGSTFRPSEFELRLLSRKDGSEVSKLSLKRPLMASIPGTIYGYDLESSAFQLMTLQRVGK